MSASAQLNKIRCICTEHPKAAWLGRLGQSRIPGISFHFIFIILLYLWAEARWGFRTLVWEKTPEKTGEPRKATDG